MKRKRKFPTIKIPNVTKEFFIKPEITNTILKQAKKDKNIIYGGQAIKKQLGILGRYTEDFDVFSKKPKKAARKTEKQIYRLWGRDHFYAKPGLHPGTHKDMSKGIDARKGTKDDVGVADYTKTPRPHPKFIVINGVRYRKLSQEKKAKYKSLKDKQFKFRHGKDRGDVERIKIATGTSK